MAGLPWFEMDVDFHGDPKIRALASRLREPLADSYVARLYAYCYQHVADRFDAGVAADTIEDACAWRGRRGTLYDALLAVQVLERTPEKVIVHGVAARLAPHVAKREADRIRIAERRDKAAESVGRRADVAETSPRRSANVAGNKDSDKDKDQKPQQRRGGLPTEGELEAARHPNAAALRQRLAEEWPGLGWTKSAPSDDAAVVRCGLDACVAACLDCGRGSKMTPEALGFFSRLLADLRPTKPSAPVPSAPAPSSASWWERLSPDAAERFHAERLAIDPDLDGAPPSVPGVRRPDAVKALIARYTQEARQ